MGLELLVGPEQELGAALKRCASGEVTGMIVLETDLYRRAPTADVDNALSRAETVVVLDQMRNATTAKATHVFPVTAFSERESTYVNYESRAQLAFRFIRVSPMLGRGGSGSPMGCGYQQHNQRL